MYLICILHYCSPGGWCQEVKTKVVEHKLVFFKNEDGSFSCDVDKGADDRNLFKSLMEGRWVRVKDTAYPA